MRLHPVGAPSQAIMSGQQNNVFEAPASSPESNLAEGKDTPELNRKIAQTKKRIQVRNDPPFDPRPSKVRPEALEGRHTVEPRPFGAVIITRPYFAMSEMDSYRVYTINPGLVKSWVGSPSHSAKRFSSCVPEATTPGSDVRLFYNVNELRVRIAPSRQHFPLRGSADMAWTEKESGNEFVILSDLWNNQS